MMEVEVEVEVEVGMKVVTERRDEYPPAPYRWHVLSGNLEAAPHQPRELPLVEARVPIFGHEINRQFP